jgi:prepilin-type N-terminal cleavage/methylation domain-containing protein
VSKQPGFTLIEILVVVSIIALLASIVLTSLEQARVKARNAVTTAQINQYRNAFALYFSDHDSYPWTVDVANGVCLGTGYSGGCGWLEGGGFPPGYCDPIPPPSGCSGGGWPKSEDSALSLLLKPYISSVPVSAKPIVFQYAGPAFPWVGALYSCSSSFPCQTPAIWWPLEKTNNCLIPGAQKQYEGGNLTLCSLYLKD